MFEQLLLSREGFYETPAETAKALETLPFDARDPEELKRALRQLPVRMVAAKETGEALSDVPDPAPVARALVEMGSLDCLSEIAYEQCGEVDWDWGMVENARIDHACVRRTLLLPILNSKRLDASTLAQLNDALSASFAFSVHDVELAAALVTALAVVGPEVSTAYLESALKNDWTEDVERLLKRLTPDQAFALFKATGKPLALRHVDTNAHARRLFDVHSAQNPLSDSVMAPVATRLGAQGATAALQKLADDPNCKIAMTARSELVRLGSSDAMPRWESAHDTDAADRLICLLQHDPERERATKELAHFFHPKRPARHVELWDIDDGGMMHESPPPDAEQQKTNDVAAKLLRVDTVYSGRTSHIERLERPRPELLRDTQAFVDDPDDSQNYDVVEYIVEDGHVYLDYVGRRFYEYIGCPC